MTIHECRSTDASFLVDAPERHVLAVELGCTPLELFAILEDPASWPRWAPGIVKVEWTSAAPHGVGATRTVSFRGGAAIDEKFDVWEPGRRMAFRVERATEPIFWSFAESYDIEPVGDGRCRLTWTVAYAPRDGFAKAHPWVRPAMRLTLRAFTLLLKRYAGRAQESRKTSGVRLSN
jgi:ribosome-associated toxin RatA of RatAB toxin-antitoxin module